MTNGTRTSFLADSNVHLYAHDQRDNLKRERAIAILDRLGAQRRGAVSTQILGEFFWNATRKITPRLSVDDALAQVHRLVDSWTVFSLTPEIVLTAIRGVAAHQFPYWDALIWATARLNGVPVVLSKDFNDGATIEGVRFLNPFRVAFDVATL